jgi:hypothetical protein
MTISWGEEAHFQETPRAAEHSHNGTHIADNRKINMKRVTVTFGVGFSLQREIAEDATIGEIIHDRNVSAAAGYGDNVRALINGVEQGEDVVPPAGSTIRVETKCNAKA